MLFATLRETLAYAADNYGLQLLETEEFRKRVEVALTASDRWEQRRCRLKAPLVVWFVFSMVLRRTASIVALTKQLLSDFRYEEPQLSLSSVTSEAFIHARERLGSKPLRLIFRQGAAEVDPTPSFYGLRTWAVDGCAMNVPDTVANDKAFGRPKASRGETAFPKLHFVSVLDTASRRIADVVIGRHDQTEREALVQMLGRLGVGDLLLMDRGFAAVWLFERCLNKNGVHVLGRIGSNWKPRVIRRVGPGDYVVEVTGDVPKRFRRKSNPKDKRGPATVTQTLRLLEFTIGKSERVRLLTTLIDAEKYPAVELAGLYHERWEIEMVHDELKTHLAVVTQGTLDLPFRSKTPGGVYQELYAYLSLYNTIRSMMAEAAELRGASPLHISFVLTVELIRIAMPRYLAARSDTEKRAVYCQLITDISECNNDRPRRKRQCPRAVKIKMSKFPLKGTRVERVLDVAVHLE